MILWIFSIIIVIVNAIQLPQKLQHAFDCGLLTRPRPNIYVLGTVHIGSESAEEASLLVEWAKPNSVIVEVPPSRVKRIRKNIRDQKKLLTQKVENNNNNNKQQKPDMFRTLLALGERGWASGGMNGLIFSVAVLGGSLLKKSFSADEEANTLPRRDEFDAAIRAADAVNATVIAADYEIDELIDLAAQRISLQGWFSLCTQAVAESIGLRSPDPIRRKAGESVVDWALRRRNIETARASQKHAEESSLEFSQLLVDERDDKFTECCVKYLDDSNTKKNEKSVCIIVGLVHLDGVTERLSQ